MPAFQVIAWRAGFFCSECMGAVPLNAVAPRLSCSHCQSSVDAEEPIRTLAHVFLTWGPPLRWPLGERKAKLWNDLRAEGEARVAVCRSCQSPLDNVDLGRPGQIAPSIACRACGESMTVRAADDLVRSLESHTKLILGEVLASAGPPAAAGAILCACLQCGGSLSVDGTKRVVVCGYCQASNFISDALWLRMHPALKKQWIYLCQ
jgi:hypothetical protein